MGSSRNRSEGHRWERTIVTALRSMGIYPHAVTTRSENRSRDASGVDVCNRNEAEHGRMIDDFQAKTSASPVKFEQLLMGLREQDHNMERIPAVLWRKTGKSKEGKFMERGRFAIVFMDDYFQLLKFRQAAHLLLNSKDEMLNGLRASGLSEEADRLEKRLAELSLHP